MVMLKRYVVAVFLGAWALGTALSQHAPGKVDFRRDVQPIFKQFCIECHGPSQQMHGFRLDWRRDAMRGGTIAVIAPGNSAGSRLYLKLIGTQFGPQMPATGPLAQEQIDIIKAWIDQGAEWPDELSGDVPPSPPDPRAEPVLKALREGDRQAFKKLVSKSPNLGSLEGLGGTTPLMQAALYGDVDSVRLLLQQGADPNIRNDAGATALMWAADERYFSCFFSYSSFVITLIASSFLSASFAFTPESSLPMIASNSAFFASISFSSTGTRSSSDCVGRPPY
jgi:hypothetical protein